MTSTRSEPEDRALVAGLVRRFQVARRDSAMVVLEGFHALKHALRFGAEVEAIVTFQASALMELAGRFGPDVAAQIQSGAIEVSRSAFSRLGPYEPHTGVVSIAKRRLVDPLDMLACTDPAPLVLLEDPRHRGNLGAVIRVAAAAGPAGVLSTGEQDPWNPVVVRGSAGLHFAVPVARVLSLPASERALLAFDPRGEPLRPELVPPAAILAFGSERLGLSAELIAAATLTVSLPMRRGVSSLNLATSVAAALYTLRLAGEGARCAPGDREERTGPGR